MRHLIAAGLTCCLVLAGCARQAEPPTDVDQMPPSAEWQTVTPAAMNETQKAQHELCLAATNAMVSETLGELEAALEGGDAAEGIAVCRIKAPEIASQVSQQFGLKIGRTSHRLRNPANVPPVWAESLVAAKTEEPTFLAGPNGEFAALLPMRLKAECQMCHGPVETIADEVLTAIEEHYPEDQGFGFAEGELRGWIWVEAPPGAEEEAEATVL